jgi:hypothetical protein
MKLIKIGKKGQLTISRALLRAAGISDEALVVAEATADGTIVLRQVETYSEARVAEFAAANTIPAALERGVKTYLTRTRAKR